jgi:hypothetical protein
MSKTEKLRSIFQIGKSEHNHKYFRESTPWLPKNTPIKCEGDVHPHVEPEMANLFHAYNAGTTELEVLNWLNATVMLLKPTAILETGAADGLGTIALASACRANGFGSVHCVELDEKLCRQSEARLRSLGLSEFAKIHCSTSFDFLNSTQICFDMGFFDSMCEIRVDEYRILRKKNQIRKLAVFHDTSSLRCESLEGWPSKELHEKYRADLYCCKQDSAVEGFIESELSRGIVAIWLKSHVAGSQW